MFRGLFSGGSNNDRKDRGSDDKTVAELRDLLEGMIKALVDEPDKISLESSESDEGIGFELRVAKADLGKVIGKKGRTASAMRTILSAASRKYRMGADLKIVE